MPVSSGSSLSRGIAFRVSAIAILASRPRVLAKQQRYSRPVPLILSSGSLRLPINYEPSPRFHRTENQDCDRLDTLGTVQCASCPHVVRRIAVSGSVPSHALGAPPRYPRNGRGPPYEPHMVYWPPCIAYRSPSPSKRLNVAALPVPTRAVSR